MITDESRPPVETFEQEHSPEELSEFGIFHTEGLYFHATWNTVLGKYIEPLHDKVA